MLGLKGYEGELCPSIMKPYAFEDAKEAFQH
jgi:hypothetical protein